IGGSEQGLVNNYRLIGFGYYSPETYSPVYVGMQETSIAGSGKGDLIFGTRSVTTDTAPSERMRIDSNGNVGIGTNAPLTVLDVRNGAIAAGSQSSTLGGEVRFYETGVTGDNFVAFRAPANLAATSTWLLPNADGANGSVLTTNGAGSLAWAAAAGGDFLKNGSVTMTGQLKGIAPTTAAAPSFTFANDTDTGMYSLGNGTLNFAANGSDFMRYGAGTAQLEYIGIPSVYQTFEWGNASNHIWASQNSAAQAAFLVESGASGSSKLGAVTMSNNTMSISTSSQNGSAPISFKTNDIPRMLIATSGEIGIGTSSPEALLHTNASLTGDAATYYFGTKNITDIAPSGASSATGYYGAFRRMTTSSSNITGRDIMADESSLHFYGGSGAPNSATASNISVVNYAGRTISVVNGLASTIESNNAGSTIGTAYGLSTNINNVAGTITNAYGLYVGNIQATNKWSILTQDATAPSSFAGAVVIGANSLSTGVKLDVVGQIVSRSNNNVAATTFDFANGNTQYTSTACSGGAAWALSNMADGGTYTINVKNNTHTGMCTFSHTGLT
ncbi:MAG: hypothetical protein AAB250_04355, partial [Bdellovibrionota bacterium]